MRFTPHRTGDDLRKSTHSYEETTLHQAKCGNSSARHISITKIGQQIEKGRRSPTGVTSRDETSVWRENPKCGVTVVSAYAPSEHTRRRRGVWALRSQGQNLSGRSANLLVDGIFRPPERNHLTFQTVRREF